MPVVARGTYLLDSRTTVERRSMSKGQLTIAGFAYLIRGDSHVPPHARFRCLHNLFARSQEGTPSPGHVVSWRIVNARPCERGFSPMRGRYSLPRQLRSSIHRPTPCYAMLDAAVAKEVTDMSRGKCGVLSYDCRGHGRTRTLSNQEKENLDVDVLTADLVNLIHRAAPSATNSVEALFLVADSSSSPKMIQDDVLEAKKSAGKELE
ncbi:hypothetical protein V8D89_015852, partial [Ganoderma adspersum]